MFGCLGEGYGFSMLNFISDGFHHCMYLFSGKSVKDDDFVLICLIIHALMVVALILDGKRDQTNIFYLKVFWECVSV